MVSFTVYGEPYGKPRSRSTRSGRHYRTKQDLDYENHVVMMWMQYGAGTFQKGAPLRLHITAVYGIPESFSKKKKEAAIRGDIKPTKKPDFDNLMKAVTDPLNKRAIHDDSQIVSVTFEKVYGVDPRVEVSIDEY